MFIIRYLLVKKLALKSWYIGEWCVSCRYDMLWTFDKSHFWSCWLVNCYMNNKNINYQMCFLKVCILRKLFDSYDWRQCFVHRKAWPRPQFSRWKVAIYVPNKIILLFTFLIFVVYRRLKKFFVAILQNKIPIFKNDGKWRFGYRQTGPKQFFNKKNEFFTYKKVFPLFFFIIYNCFIHKTTLAILLF